MEVWIVGVAECEGNYIVAICATKEIAEREILKVRDDLIKEWKEMDEHLKKQNREDDLYKRMIENLSSDDYEKWDNYPLDCPYLYKTEVLET